MQKRIRINKKQYSAGQIERATTGRCNDGSKIFSVNGEEFLYEYRTEYPDGYYNNYIQPVVAERSDASYMRVMDRAGHYLGDISL